MRSPNGRVARDMMRSALELQRVVDEKGQVFEAASITSGALLLPLDTVTALVAPAQEQAIASGVALQGLGKSLAGMSGALSAIPVIGKVVQTFVKKTARRTLEPAGEKLRNNGIRIGKLEKNLEKTGSKVSMIDGLFLASAGVLVSVAAFFYSAGDILVKAHMCAFELGEEQVVAKLEATMEAMRNGSQVLIRHLNNIPSNVTNPFGDLKLRLDILSVKLPNLLSEFTKINLALQPFMWLTKFMEFRMCFYFFIFFEECFTVGHMLNILGKLFRVLSFLVNPIADLFAGLFPDISLPLPSLLDAWLLDLDKIMLDIDIAYNTLLPAMQLPFDFTDLMLPDILAKLPDNLPCNPFDDDAEIEAEESLEDDEDETDGAGRRLAGRRWTRKDLRIPLGNVKRLRNWIGDKLPRRRASFAIPMSKRKARQSSDFQGVKLGKFKPSLLQSRPDQQATQHNGVSKRPLLSVLVENEVPRIAMMNPAADRAGRYAIHVNVARTIAEVVDGSRSKRSTVRLAMNKLFHLEVFYIRRVNRKAGTDLAAAPFACIVDFDQNGSPSRSGELSLELDGGRNYYSDENFVFVPFVVLAFKGTEYRALSAADKRKYRSLCPPKARYVQNPYKDIIVKDRRVQDRKLESEAFPSWVAGRRELDVDCDYKREEFCAGAGQAPAEAINEWVKKSSEETGGNLELALSESAENVKTWISMVNEAKSQEVKVVAARALADFVKAHFRLILGKDSTDKRLDKERILQYIYERLEIEADIQKDDFGELDSPITWLQKGKPPMNTLNVGEFADFVIFHLFPPMAKDRGKNLHRRKYFRWDTYGLCALKSVYGDLLKEKFKLDKKKKVEAKKRPEATLQAKVLQLLCEDEFARTIRWANPKNKKEAISVGFLDESSLQNMERSVYKKAEKAANNLAKARFGALLNGFVEHEVKGGKEKVMLGFPLLGKEVFDSMIEELIKEKAPICNDIDVEPRFNYMSETECMNACVNDNGMSRTRLCAGNSKEIDDETLSKECILVRCYSPTRNQKENKSFYKKGRRYWKKMVGQGANTLMAKNGKEANEDHAFDPALVDELKHIYHVEHMKDHSHGGRNAFSNFIMTWGLANMHLRQADSGDIEDISRFAREFRVLRQWEAIYGRMLRLAAHVQDFCDAHVTTEERTFSTTSVNGKRDVTIKIIPRDYSKKKIETVVKSGGKEINVPSLDIDALNQNLQKERTDPRDSRKKVEGLVVLSRLLDGEENPCQENIVESDLRPGS